MKNLLVIVNVTFLILLAFAFMTPATADEVADRDKCIAKGEKAVKLIKEIGDEAAFRKIHVSETDFRWDKGYVFVIEEEKGKLLAHSQYLEPVGSEILNKKDADGKFYCHKIIRIAETKGKGWISCNVYSRKRDCYVIKVPGKHLIVVSVLLK